MEKIKGAAWGSGLFAFVDSDLAFDSPEARITIDRAKAGEVGVSMEAIADTLAILVGENYVNRFNWHDRSYDVIAQVPRTERLTPDDLGRYYVKASSGELVPLSTVVKVVMRPQANKLPQFNQMNAAKLRSEEHTSELQSLMRISYAVFCLKNKQTNRHKQKPHHNPRI